MVMVNGNTNPTLRRNSMKIHICKSNRFAGDLCDVGNHTSEVEHTVVGICRETHHNAPRHDAGDFRATDDDHVDDVALPVRYGQREREKRVKRVAVVVTAGTGQRRPVECLEEIVDETVVASGVVGQRLGSDDLIRPTHVALQQQHCVQMQRNQFNPPQQRMRKRTVHMALIPISLSLDHCFSIAFHFLSCIVLVCCTVHYCLFSFLIFSLLATSSTKLNLNGSIALCPLK